MISGWGRSRKRIVTHAKHPTLRHATMCGADSLQRVDATKYEQIVDCKRCRAAIAKTEGKE